MESSLWREHLGDHAGVGVAASLLRVVPMCTATVLRALSDIMRICTSEEVALMITLLGVVRGACFTGGGGSIILFPGIENLWLWRWVC